MAQPPLSFAEPFHLVPGPLNSSLHPAPGDPSPGPAPWLWLHSHLQDHGPQWDEFCTYWALLGALCLPVWRWIRGPFYRGELVPAQGPSRVSLLLGTIP